MPYTPFAVKEFVPFTKGYNQRPTNFAKELNEWFTEISEDAENTYDIRQILTLKDGALLVFYEKGPTTARYTCPQCGYERAVVGSDA
jgi:hypothetical protein